MLFKKKEPEKNLSQEEREAVVDLLHLCLYADAHISVKEGQFISDVIDVIGWDTNLSFTSYESRSIASARAAKSDEKNKRDFINFAASRLKSTASRELAIDLCRDLMAADGTMPREGEVLAGIRSALGVK